MDNPTMGKSDAKIKTDFVETKGMILSFSINDTEANCVAVPHLRKPKLGTTGLFLFLDDTSINKTVIIQAS